jgi:hypothetical protein
MDFYMNMIYITLMMQGLLHITDTINECNCYYLNQPRLLFFIDLNIIFSLLYPAVYTQTYLNRVKRW